MEAEGEDERLRALAERLDGLARRIEALKPIPRDPKNVERVGPKAISNPFEKLVKLNEQAKELFEKSCCSIKADKGLSREEVERMIEEMRRELLKELSPEKVKTMLEGMGYKVIEPPRSWDEVKKLIEEGKERPYEEALDSKQIEAAKNLIERAMDSMASIFGPPISQYMRRIVVGGEDGDYEGSKEQQRPQEGASQQS
jgi:Glu-tRNA(Gln) amidotransferase subunit E-like FAD-binding protein